MFSDYFDDATISGGWTEEYTTTGSGVEYTIASGISYLRVYSGLSTQTSDEPNGVYQTLSGTFPNHTFTTKVGEPTYLTAVSENECGVGMMVYVDASNYAVVAHSKNNIGYEYSYSYQDPPGIGHGGAGGAGCTDYTLPPYYFAMTVSGVNDYIFHVTPWYADISGYLLPGKQLIIASGTLQVWLFATHQAGDDPFHADFEYFTVT